VRARILIAMGLSAGLLAACSRQAEESAADAAPADETRNLALTSSSDEAPVASELEAPRAAEPEVAPRAVPVVNRRVTPQPLGSAIAAAHDHGADAAEQAPAPPAQPQDEGGSVSAVTGPLVQPESTGTGKPRGTVQGGGRVPDPGAGGPIIIRGGAGGEDDDCKLHQPPRVGEVRPGGNTGVLINDRAPRRGPPQQVAGRTPTRGPQLGRGGIR
jgi:hypothetical protein